MRDELPPTIIYPETFLTKKPAEFDGTFDWSWTDGCFGKTKIKPMDFDGVVERKGNFIVFESKDVGVTVPQGQLITLRSLWERGGVTILFVFGKLAFEKASYILARKPQRMKMTGGQLSNVESARNFLKGWFKYANKNQFVPKI